MIESHDQKEIYCRKLGHHLTFSYCRHENMGRLCAKIKDCWWQKMDIQDFLSRNYSRDQLEHLDSPAPAKIASILELIQRARQPS